MDVQVDRLSSLPNDLIHLILSFLDIKDAIQTTALSSRYRFIWTSLPYLNFSNEDFLTLDKFFKFVNRVLPRRDTKTEVNSVKLGYRGKVRHGCVKRILNYASCHNVRQMTVKYLGDRYRRDFPLCVLRSQSLKSLTLSVCRDTNLISTWELPALTTLHLDRITFNDVFTDLLSNCLNLKNLTLSYCYISDQYNCNKRESTDYNIYHSGSISVDICHPRLSNLTLIHEGRGYGYVLNVDTPQLKNLTIKDWSPVHLRYAPKLHSLVFRGYHTHILLNSPNGLCSLDKADLCFYELQLDYEEDYDDFNYEYGKLEKTHVVHEVVDILQQVRSVKYLRLNKETIRLLCSFKELISHQPFSFTNLTSIKVYPHERRYMRCYETEYIEVNLPKSSSGTTLTVVCEEIIAMKNALSAELYMERLWEMLDREKAKFETNMSPAGNHETMLHKEGEAQVENEKAQPVEKKKLDIRGRMEKIKTCWRAIGFPISGVIERTSDIFYWLAEIEELLLGKLPTSKRGTLEACFSSLKTEVDTVVKKMIDGMKIECDEKQSHLSDHIHELAATYQTFS